MTVRVALISGPMYDALYARLPEFTRLTGIDVELAFQGDHPALNEFLATEAAAACDLVSTHTKYCLLRSAHACRPGRLHARAAEAGKHRRQVVQPPA